MNLATLSRVLCWSAPIWLAMARHDRNRNAKRGARRDTRTLVPSRGECSWKMAWARATASEHRMFPTLELKGHFDFRPGRGSALSSGQDVDPGAAPRVWLWGGGRDRYIGGTASPWHTPPTPNFGFSSDFGHFILRKGMLTFVSKKCWKKN